MSYGKRQFTIDAAADLTRLPKDVRIGSMCYVVETGNSYILNNAKQWVLYKGSSDSGGGNSNESDIVIINDTTPIPDDDSIIIL